HNHRRKTRRVIYALQFAANTSSERHSSRIQQGNALRYGRSHDQCLATKSLMPFDSQNKLCIIKLHGGDRRTHANVQTVGEKLRNVSHASRSTKARVPIGQQLPRRRKATAPLLSHAKRLPAAHELLKQT